MEKVTRNEKGAQHGKNKIKPETEPLALKMQVQKC